MILECDALLFDLDGTLIDSLPAVDRAWTEWAMRNSLDPLAVLPRIHGRRSIDSIRALAPHLDAETENNWLRSREASDTAGVVALAGALAFVSSLPAQAWTIVTSGTRDVASPRLCAAGFEVPHGAVCGDDVLRGKPAPDPFLLAAQRLGVNPERCLVFEDTLAGLKSGQAAGSKTIGVRILPGEDLSPLSEFVITGYHEIRVASPVGARPIVLSFGE